MMTTDDPTRATPAHTDDAITVADGIADLFRRANGAMVVVTAADEHEESGCLVAFHSQISIEPPRWGVWMSKLNHTYPVVIASPTVVVHFLGEEDHALANHFGHLTGDTVNKFASIAVARRVGGTPILANCQNYLVGRRVDVLNTDGDSSCVVLKPVEVEYQHSFRPLRYADVVDIEPGHPETG